MALANERLTEPADRAAFAAARRLCLDADPSLRLALQFLPSRKRDGVAAIGAFCGMIVEALAQPGDQMHGAAGLRHHPVAVSSAAGACCSSGGADSLVALIRERIDAIYERRLELPAPTFRSPQQHALHAFAMTIEQFEIPRSHCIGLADAWARDAGIHRYPTWNALSQHCHDTGGTIAAMAGCVLGMTHSGAASDLPALGAGLRLAHIVSNIDADRSRGRLFLPLEDMVRCRHSEREWSEGRQTPALRELVRIEVGRARDLLRRGCAAIPWLAGDRSRLGAALVVVQTDERLRAVERGRAHLHRPARVRQIATAWCLARRREGDPMPKGLFESRRQ